MSRYSFHHMHNNKLTLKAILILCVFLFLAGASMVSVYKNDIASAFTLATTHQPESFTELYFINSRSLPLYSPTLKPQRVTFRITNHESRQVTYAYIVTQDGVKLAESTVVLSDGQSTDVTFVYIIPTPATPTTLSVSLVGRPEHIDFRSKS